jgi:iron(III) transport system substrate-binding protein
MSRRSASASIVLGIGFALAATLATAQGNLTVYCSYQIDWCNAMVNAFSKETGIKVSMLQKSAGETFAQIKAEAANPKGDIWWTGSGDAHMQAAEEGLTIAYQSPMLKDLQDWARRQAEQSGYRTVGVYAGPLGIGYNPDLIAKKGLPAPKCWRDLIRTEYKGEVQIANPNSSGTAYVAIATFVQLMGEDEAFRYLKALNTNVNQYTKSGAGPVKAVGRAETAVGVAFMHDAIAEKAAGFPVVSVAPCEGTGYEIGSMSLISGARNLDNAKKFYDWALSPAAQALGAENKAYPIPSNRNTPLSPLMPRLSDVKLINYDFAKYGSAAERRRLLQKWETEVNAQPR